MEDERESAQVFRSARSDPSGSHSGFEPSAKLRERIKKLGTWRISPSSIKSPKDTLQSHGGHATVSKAFLLDADPEHSWHWRRSYKPREVLQLCRQSSESEDHIGGAADHQRDAEGELGGEGKDDEEDEHWSDSDIVWQGEFVAVKKSRIGDNNSNDLERVLGLALRETEFLVGLSHKNIVQLKGFVEDLTKDIIWLVFPWAENGNLKDFVASRDWEIPERISLIKDVAEGLDYLHGQKPPICHGDLKSYNVLVNSRHLAMITDFGSARHLTDHDLNRRPGLVQNQKQPLQATFSTLSKTITLTGNIYTLRWAAPELLNDDEMSPWSDMWALGWIAYEVLTDSIPFHDVLNQATVIERVIKGDLPSVDEHARVMLFQGLCSVMTTCWNSNPNERPTARDFVRAVSDMPMVVPDTANGAYSVFSSRLSSEVLMRRGGRGQESGDSAMAFACFTEAHRIYTKIGDRKGKADALDRLGELRRAQEEYSEATANYSESLQIYTDIGNMEGRASTLQGLAEVHRVRKEYSEAIPLYSEALEIHAAIRHREGRASALSGLAQVHHHQKEYSDAITLYCEVLQIHTDIGNKEGRANALWGLAEVYRLRIECNEAVALRSEGLPIRTDIDDKRGRAYALWGLADVHRVQEKYGEAMAHCSEGLEICIDIGDRQGQADALWGIANVYQAQQKYIEGIAHYSKALQICTDIGDEEGRADALSGLAQAHHHQMEYSQAITLYSEALQIRPDIGDRRAKANAQWSLAEVHQERAEYSEAVKLYSEAILTGVRDDLRGRANRVKGLAQELQLRKEYRLAIALYSKVLLLYTSLTSIGSIKYRASALFCLAQMHKLQEEYSLAFMFYFMFMQIYPVDDTKNDAERNWFRKEYNETIELRSRRLFGDEEVRADALWRRAEVHRLQKEYGQAVVLFSEALQIWAVLGDRQGMIEAQSGLDHCPG